MVEIDEEPIAEEAGGWMNLPEELPEEAVKSLKQLARCAFGIAAPPLRRCFLGGRRWRLRLRPRRCCCAARFRAWASPSRALSGWALGAGSGFLCLCHANRSAAHPPLTSGLLHRNAGMFVLAIYLFRAKTEWFKVPPLPPMPAQ